MDRNVLMESSEGEFFEAIWNSIRTDGSDRFVDAIFNDPVEYEGGKDKDSDDFEESIDTDYGADNDSGDDDDNDVDHSDDSDDGSVENLPIFIPDRIRIHDPVVHQSHHCPPFDDMTQTFCGDICGVCDCYDFNFARCLQETNYLLLKETVYTIDFDEQLLLAKDGVDNLRRTPNNEMRKFYYKKLFVCLDFGALDKGERKRLPNCAAAKVRQIFPSNTGFYMGFKEF